MFLAGISYHVEGLLSYDHTDDYRVNVSYAAYWTLDQEFAIPL